MIIASANKPASSFKGDRFVARIRDWKAKFERHSVALTALLHYIYVATEQHDVPAFAEMQVRKDICDSFAIALKPLATFPRRMPGQSRLHGFVEVTEPPALAVTPLPASLFTTLTLL